MKGGAGRHTGIPLTPAQAAEAARLFPLAKRWAAKNAAWWPELRDEIESRCMDALVYAVKEHDPAKGPIEKLLPFRFQPAARDARREYVRCGFSFISNTKGATEPGEREPLATQSRRPHPATAVADESIADVDADDFARWTASIVPERDRRAWELVHVERRSAVEAAGELGRCLTFVNDSLRRAAAAIRADGRADHAKGAA